MRQHRSLSLVLSLCLLASCAANLTTQEKAIKAAEVSFATYESVSNAVVTQTKKIMDFRKVRALTRADRVELSRLDELRGILDRYSVAHNGYVEALKFGRDAGPARQKLIDLWNQVRTAAIDLQLKFNAVAP